MFFITLFRKAGATGHVFLLKSKSIRDKGLSWSGLIGPGTTVAVVPTTTRFIDFAFEARTLDKQTTTVTGNLKVTLSPEKAVRRFDFTVDRESGAYLNPWEQQLRTILMARVPGPVRKQVKTEAVDSVIHAHKDIEDAVIASLKEDGATLARYGIDIESCSIDRIKANDPEVDLAIGAKERQSMLADADKALHDRRIKGAENERAVQTYEAETQLELEKARGELIAEESKNKIDEARADADATKTRLAPMSDVEAGKLLGAALLEMAKSGRIGNLVVSPELLAALKQG